MSELSELVDGLKSILGGILTIGEGLLSFVGELLSFAVSSFQEGDLLGIMLCLFILCIVFKIKNGIF